MKIGLFVRTDQLAKPGGDVIQAQGYVRALRAQGVEAAVVGGIPDLAGLDVLHVFNVDRPWDCLALVQMAHRRGITIVLSSIAHPREALLRYQATRSFWWERGLLGLGLGADSSERLKALARAISSRNLKAAGMALRLAAPEAKRRLWSLTSGIQLLSHAEYGELRKQGFDFTGRAAVVVRNGVSPATVEQAAPDPALATFVVKHPRFAVVGGRIEPRKNQLEVLEIVAELGIPTVFAGAENRRHRGYCDKFRRQILGNERMLYLGNVSRGGFARLLQLAHMHVSASLFEVSPLVDLEARALGRRVVATASSFGVEFLDAGATICDPWDRASIRAAIDTAWTAQEPVGHLPVPTWDDTGTPLVELYRQARARRTPPL